jgi:hypothetical protein
MMANMMLKSWQAWYNEADIPMKDEKGEWYDAETGHYWKDSIQKKAVLERDPLFKESLAKLMAKVENLIKSTEYSISKFSDAPEYAVAVKAASELVTYYYAAKAFKKLTKQDVVDIINKNSDVSRMLNKVKVALQGEN